MTVQVTREGDYYIVAGEKPSKFKVIVANAPNREAWDKLESVLDGKASLETLYEAGTNPKSKYLRELVLAHKNVPETIRIMWAFEWEMI